MPTVNPPPRFAPFADASMTPFRPPHTRMASARAMRNPTSSARAIPSREAVLPPPITATIGFLVIKESPFTRTLALRLCRNGFKGENEPRGGARGATKLGIALMPVHRFGFRGDHGPRSHRSLLRRNRTRPRRLRGRDQAGLHSPSVHRRAADTEERDLPRASDRGGSAGATAGRGCEGED